MFCEKCGVKNENGSAFCVSCGNKMSEVKAVKSGNTNNFVNKIKGLSKKTKILIGSISLLVIAGIIILVTVLNNPVRVIRNELQTYYETGNQESLDRIGEVLIKNKNKKDTLNEIKKASSKELDNWIVLFNKEYKNKEFLYYGYNDDTLTKIDAIYEEYNGLEYIMSEEYHDELTKSLEVLYDSKIAYLSGKESEEADELLDAYNYYIKVIEEDVYYEKAQKYVNEYIKEHIKDFEEEAKKIVDELNPETDEEIKEAYIKQLEFLSSNKIYDGLDVTNTEVYKNLLDNAKKIVIEKVISIVKTLDKTTAESSNLDKYEAYIAQSKYLADNLFIAGIDFDSNEEYVKIDEDITKKIYETSKTIASEYKTKYDYDSAIEILEDAKDYMPGDSTYYTDLEDLVEEYEENKPVEIVSLNYIDNSYQIYKTTIDGSVNDIDYDSHMRFGFDGENEYMTFNIEKKYTKFRAQIVRGNDWEKNQKGTIVIYGDDKELYRSSSITATNEFDGMIDIDVTGVSHLKVELQTTYNSRKGMFNYLEYIYVINGLLYK